jgi:hypothetical protein
MLYVGTGPIRGYIYLSLHQDSAENSALLKY